MNIRARKRRQLRAIGFDYRRRFTPCEIAVIDEMSSAMMRDLLAMSACIKRHMEDT